MKQHALCMEDRRLALALQRCRTEVTFGYTHYCTSHQQPVDKQHINECSHIASHGYSVTDIVTGLEGLQSFWNLDVETLSTLKDRLLSLRHKISHLCQDKVFVLI